jgi:riboflavin synthase
VFTGIVTEIGEVRAAASGRLTIACGRVLDGLRPGDAIAVDGVHLIIAARDPQRFTADLTAETIWRTTLDGRRPGDRVNLEAPLRLGAPVNGHLVTGIVEGIGVVDALVEEGAGLLVRLHAPARLMPAIVLNGPVAVDGAGLTVVERDDDAFTVLLVPSTRRAITLSERRTGDRVNLETDLMARYARQALAERPAPRRTSTNRWMTIPGMS